jgi:hypothetical protein
MLVSRSFQLLVAATLALTACRRKHEPADDGTVATSATSSSATSGSPDDYGPPADVRAVRAAWLDESSGHDTIPQIVVVNGYGVVEVRNGGPNSPFFVLFTRDPAGSWTDQGMIVGQVGLCGLSSRIPDSVARAIVAHDIRLAANQRANPNAGCSGAI